MAASNVTIEVQEYLDKQKIDALFEDMRAKLVKNLPSDPINYLINVLKGIQEKKKRTLSSRGSTSNSRMEVAGRPIKPTATDKLTKSADNTRPHTSSTPRRLPQQSAVATRPATKTKAPETPATPKSASSTTKDTPRPLKDTPRPSSKTATPRAAKASTAASKPSSTTRPSTAPTNGQTKTTRSTKPQSSSSTSKVPTSRAKVTTKPAASKTTPTKPTTGSAKRILKSTAPATNNATTKASEDTIDEFFGEKKKSSSKQLFVSEQEEIGELEGKEDNTSVAEETEMISSEPTHEDTTLIDAYLEKKKSQSKDTRSDHLKDLQDMILMDQKSADCNNHDDDEGNDEGEEPVSLLEDTKLLQEEEGVDTIKSQDGHTKQVMKKQVVTTTGGRQTTLICARCARMMTMGDMAAATADDNFESASQVTSQSNFPSWDATSTTVAEQSTADSEKLSNDDNDSTVVSVATTATSKDEWAGLTQANRPPPISDSESEVQVPKIPLSGKSWTPPPTHESDDPSTVQQWAT